MDYVKNKVFNIDEVIDFIANCEDNIVDFTGIKLYKLTMNDGTVFLRISSNGESFVIGKNGSFISLIMNSRNFNGEDSAYEYIKKNSRSENYTNLLLQRVKERISQEGEIVSIVKVMEAFGGMTKCKVIAHGSKSFTVKTIEKTQFCGYVNGKIFTVIISEESAVNCAN